VENIYQQEGTKMTVIMSWARVPSEKEEKTGLQGHVTPLEDISMLYVLISYNKLQFNEYRVYCPGSPGA
jgi:hypothetical protein